MDRHSTSLNFGYRRPPSSKFRGLAAPMCLRRSYVTIYHGVVPIGCPKEPHYLRAVRLAAVVMTGLAVVLSGPATSTVGDPSVEAFH